MIHIKNLTKIYHSDSGDVKALEDVNLHIKQGEIFGVIGLSVPGKAPFSGASTCWKHLQQAP